MRGEHSGVLPDAELNAMLTGQPDAETRVIPDAGHVNMLDDEGVQDAIIDFIDQHRMPEGTRQ
jgi:pimeloyl-ACP methyl ester carboxylesterase